MSKPKTTTGAAKYRAGAASIQAWLAGRQRGRWATSRGRWIQTALTVALLLTGMSAWALAIVQPWTTKQIDHGIFTLASGVNAERVRSAAVGLDELIGDPPTPTARPLRRNPFDHTSPTAEEPGDPEGSTPRTASGETATADQPTPRQILEAVKGLRLEVILIGPAGERWAVINGEDYREGDAVAGLEIVEIQEGRVKLRRRGVTCLLRMD